MSLNRVLYWVVTFALMTACGKKTGSVAISRLEPPVQQTAGTALTSNSSSATSSKTSNARTLINASVATTLPVQDRFFSGGPTDILRILSEVDLRLADVESRANAADSACMSQAPVETTLHIFGETVTFNFQCYTTIYPSGIMLVGKKDDTWSIYVNAGAGVIAAKATELSNSKTSVEVWGGVGYGNVPAWDTMSYTGFHLKANNSTDTLEMTAGGMGVGYCGVTLKSDGTNLYVIGSEDGPGCANVSSDCLLSSDLSTPGSCSSIDENHFELAALGRISVTGSQMGIGPATWEASKYPASPTLQLDGTNSDMLQFGISSQADVPAGVGSF